jgi:PHD/YefM family antitoxin component YafN of YafNO toxin-antitoxin module
MTDSILSLKEFAADSGKWLNRIREHPDNLVLTEDGRARAVLQDFERYQEEQRALLLLKLMAQGEADIQAGRLRRQDEIFEQLKSRLQEKVPR